MRVPPPPYGFLFESPNFLNTAKYIIITKERNICIVISHSTIGFLLVGNSTYVKTKGEGEGCSGQAAARLGMENGSGV